MDANSTARVTQYLKANDKARARELLMEIIRQSPRDEQAWLLMAQAVEDPAQQRDCFTRVLAINPDNAIARRKLAALSNPSPLSEPTPVPQPPAPQPPSAKPKPTPSKPTPASTATPRATAPSKKPQPTAASKPKPSNPSATPTQRPTSSTARKPPARKAPARKPAPQAAFSSSQWLWIAGGGLGLMFVLIFGLAGAWIINNNNQAKASATAAALAQAKVTITSSFPTLPPTWTVAPVTPTPAFQLQSASPTPINPQSTTSESNGSNGAGGGASTPSATDSAQAPNATSAPLAGNSLHLNYLLLYTSYWTSGDSYLSNGNGQQTSIPGKALGWLPNGQGILSVVYNADKTHDLMETAIDGTGSHKLFDFVGAMNAALSPDGTRVAYVVADAKNTKSYTLQVINIDGTGHKVLDTMPYSGSLITTADWSPDNQQILYTKQTCENKEVAQIVLLCDSELYRINADGSQLTQITEGIRGAFNPRWSPDGKQIVFNIASPDEWSFVTPQLVITDPNGSDYQGLQLIGAEDKWQQIPEWSPDGESIIFVSDSTTEKSTTHVVPTRCFTEQNCSWKDAVEWPIDADSYGRFIWHTGPPAP